MSRFARSGRVFFFEEPVFEDGEPQLKVSVCTQTGVTVATPVLPHGLEPQMVASYQAKFLKSLVDRYEIRDYVAWYYTPMAREYAQWLSPAVSVYDCMDELSCFAGAPAAMRVNELALFREADLVFTGGASLYESKRKQHGAVYLFPSSVDVAHFRGARSNKTEPGDQAEIGYPRLGYAGVIDERMDLELIREAAAARPEWQFVFLGPVVKIDVKSLPRAGNIHYLGMKPYAELPGYFSGWQAGMLPFALNESTRFISPTKTPEYLAAGLHVISTPIRDVITPYGDLGVAQIAGNASEFIRVAESVVNSPKTDVELERIDRFLGQSSWDKTWSDMSLLIEEVLRRTLLQTTPAGSLTGKGAAHV